jgi:hypothetical protein
MKSMRINFGYESRFDGESWIFDLCDDCLVTVVKSFMHVPDGFKIDNSYNLVKYHQKVFDEWKETGTWDEFVGYTYEELLELKDNSMLDIDFINSVISNHYPDHKLIEEKGSD